MWSRNERQSASRLLLRRLGTLALFAFVITAASGVWEIYQKERESRTRRTEAESERGDLLKREAQLKSNIVNLKTDRGVEKTLREQYALAEAGEGMIIILDSPPQALKATSTQKSWLQRLFHWR